jgi:hypothetical protein
VHRGVAQVLRDAPRTADAGDDRDLVLVEIQRQQGVDEAARDDAVGAAPAPQGLRAAQTVADLCRGMPRDLGQRAVARRPLYAFFID